jgi:hypothetical protein
VVVNKNEGSPSIVINRYSIENKGLVKIFLAYFCSLFKALGLPFNPVHPRGKKGLPGGIQKPHCPTRQPWQPSLPRSLRHPFNSGLSKVMSGIKEKPSRDLLSENHQLSKEFWGSSFVGTRVVCSFLKECKDEVIICNTLHLGAGLG